MYLYNIFWSLISTVTRYGYRDSVGKIWNEFQKVYTGSEIFTAEIHLVKN